MAANIAKLYYYWLKCMDDDEIPVAHTMLQQCTEKPNGLDFSVTTVLFLFQAGIEVQKMT